MVSEPITRRAHAPTSFGPKHLLALLLMSALAAAFIAGLVAASGEKLFVGVFAAAIIGSAIIFSPRLHFILAMVFTLVLGGILDYFSPFEKSNWLSSILVGAMLVSAFLRAVMRKDEWRQLSLFGVLTCTYVLMLVVSSLVNAIPVAQAIVGVRNYFPYIGVAVLLIYGGFDDEFLRRLPKIFLAIGLIQVPFALVQHFVYVPIRAVSLEAINPSNPQEKLNAVVGTFGGSVLGGGYTGEMAAFLVFMVIFAFAMRRERIIGTPTLLLVAPILLIPVLVAETKVAFIMLPLLFVACFYRDLVRNPKFFLSTVVLVLLLAGVIVATYFIRDWRDAEGVAQFMGYSFRSDTGVNIAGRSRMGTLVHWYEMNITSRSIVSAWIGHGMASTLQQSFSIGIGSAVRAFGPHLDTHAMSRLLWDGGLITFFLFSVLLLRSFQIGSRLSRNVQSDPADRAAATLVAAMALGFFVMLPYQVSSLGGSAMQFLVWFCIGYGEVMRRRVEALSPRPITDRKGRATGSGAFPRTAS